MRGILCKNKEEFEVLSGEFLKQYNPGGKSKNWCAPCMTLKGEYVIKTPEPASLKCVDSKIPLKDKSRAIEIDDDLFEKIVEPNKDRVVEKVGD